MCLLAYFPPNAMPIQEHLEEACYSNPDGFGWGIVTPSDGIVTGHTMDPSEAIAEFTAARSVWPEGPALFHARITTHGVTSLDNCHPFLISGRQDMILAHNGILPREVQPRIGDVRSDTRILAESYLTTRFPRLDSRRTRRKFEAWLGTGSKVLVLSVNPRYRRSAYLFNEHLGNWDSGVWYSNCSYMPYIRPKQIGTYLYATSYPGRLTRSPAIDDRWGPLLAERYPDSRVSRWDAEEADVDILSAEDIEHSIPMLDSDVGRYAADCISDSLCSLCDTMGLVRRSDLVCEWCETCQMCDQSSWMCQCARLANHLIAPHSPGMAAIEAPPR